MKTCTQNRDIEQFDFIIVSVLHVIKPVTISMENCMFFGQCLSYDYYRPQRNVNFPQARRLLIGAEVGWLMLAHFS